MNARRHFQHKLAIPYFRFVAECACGLAAVALFTYLGLLLRLNVSVSGLIYLLMVLLVALWAGFRQAVLVSLAALLCTWYFVVPPAYTWAVSDPANYVEMFVFFATALIVSRLSSRVEQHADEAIRQRESFEKLYNFTRKALLLDLHKKPASELASRIAEVFPVDAIAIYDADLDTLESRGDWPVNPMELAKSTCLFEVNQDDAMWRLSRRVLRLGEVAIGALLIRGDLKPLTVDAIASLVSMSFDRYRGFTNETRAEAARQTEQLRTAVLDRLAHTFKTPLTAIRTASAGLLELGSISPAHADLASLIDEQSALLNELATRLLQAARLEPEELSLQKEKVAIADVIEDVIGNRSGVIDGHALEVSMSDEGLATRGDRELLATIVRQFVDNAAKYSYPGTKISISAEECASEIIVAVHNEGEPIPGSDRQRIFDRYYRSPATEQLAPGTGIGLSVAKKAAEAHNGHVWVTSDGQLGTTFYLSVKTVKGSAIEPCEQ